MDARIYFLHQMRRSFRPVLLASVVYGLLTIALTWPLVVRPASLVPNDLGDPLLNAWILAWDARVVPLTGAWWNSPQFYPVPGTMAFSEHLLGLSIFSTPIIWLTGDALVAYNVVFFLSFVLSALAAYFLAFTISRRHDCAFLAGLAFGFAPYRMAQFAHVQVLSAYWMPVALAALHRYFENRRVRWLVAVCRVVAAPVPGVRLLPVLPLGAHRAVAAVVCQGAKSDPRAHLDRDFMGHRGGPAGSSPLWLLALSTRVWAPAGARRDDLLQR